MQVQNASVRFVSKTGETDWKKVGEESILMKHTVRVLRASP